MAAGTLYTYPKNFRAYKVLIAAKYSGADVRVDPNFKFGETNKSADFLAKFPLGKVPAFASSNGVNVFESNAIAKLVGNKTLQGETAESEAFIQQWIDFGDNEILPAACTWVFPCLGITQFNKQDTERAKAQIIKALTFLNEYLLTRTYLVGEKITQADISLACNLISLYENVLDSDFRKSFQNVNRWFTTVINQPNFKSVTGEIKLAETMAQFDAKKYAELHGGQGGGGGGDKKKEKKEKAPKQEKPKEEKPAKVAKEPEPKEEEDDEPKAKESKDPFLAFPKGNFDMDEWKRTYSNQDTATVAIPYFWDKFDKEHYSIWKCEYTEDLSDNVTFQTCNLVSGLFQRLDKMRKHAFASIVIGGPDKKNTITGVWIWRSHELAFTLSEDWQVDYESYKWTKLDPDDPETKKIVNAYLLWEGDFGAEFNQGKIYK